MKCDVSGTGWIARWLGRDLQKIEDVLLIRCGKRAISGVSPLAARRQNPLASHYVLRLNHVFSCFLETQRHREHGGKSPAGHSVSSVTLCFQSPHLPWPSSSRFRRVVLFVWNPCTPLYTKSQGLVGPVSKYSWQQICILFLA